MNIGILAYRQYPYISANTDIGYKIGEYVKKNSNNNVIHLGWKQDECQDEVSEYKETKIRFLNNNCSDSKIINKLKQKFLRKVVLLKDAFVLKEIIKEEKIDALICITAPNNNAKVATIIKMDIPVYIYQLDPFYNWMDCENKKEKKEFLNILAKVKHLFTTDLLDAIYRKDDQVCKYNDKISVVKFPKLENPGVSGAKDIKNSINLLYAGSLYHGIRNPQILIDLKNNLPENYKVVFCGSCDKQEDMIRLEKNGIVCKGYCSENILKEEIDKAVALVNIGNSVKNQMGSKIIDYIATGKPIVNIIQFENCPTVDVLKDYGLKLSIHKNELGFKEKSEELKEFINKNINNKIVFEEVEKHYFEYTPEYVAKKILSVLMSEKR